MQPNPNRPASRIPHAVDIPAAPPLPGKGPEPMGNAQLPSAGEIRKGLEQQAAAKQEEGADPNAKKRNRVYTFDFDYSTPWGERRHGRFTNHVLSKAEERQKAVIVAAMLNHAPLTSISEGVRRDTELTAHLSMSLDQKPEWADNLDNEVDDGLFEALRKEVTSHEACFLRLDQHNPAG